MSLRIGVCLLPDVPWRRDATRWREADEAGFAHLWTYDHLSWRAEPTGTWQAAVPLLTAAATVTRRARLGPLVATPNFRHPVPFAAEVRTLVDLSGGRLDLGLGAGGMGADTTALGDPPPTPAERAGRFEWFTEELHRLLGGPDRAVPFTVAAAGARALAVAARMGQTWVTYGPTRPVDGAEAWFSAVRRQAQRLDDACAEAGRPPGDLRRMVLVGLELGWAQCSPGAWDDTVGRLEAAGFTDVVVHWPRPHDERLPGPPPAVFDHVAGSLPASG